MLSPDDINMYLNDQPGTAEQSNPSSGPNGKGGLLGSPGKNDKQDPDDSSALLLDVAKGAAASALVPGLFVPNALDVAAEVARSSAAALFDDENDTT